MNNTRLTFNASTNLTLPLAVYSTLRSDARNHGYIKNGRPNVSGYMNQLIPVLSDYQDLRHQEVLKYANGDTELTKFAEQCIQNIYLAPFTFSDDSVINVPFRINKEHYDVFLKIHDVKLSYYNTDFTNYVRNLLSEYASKTECQREYLFAFKIIESLKTAMENGNLCHFHCIDTNISFIPVSLEISPLTDRYIVFGCSDNKKGRFVDLAKIKSVITDIKCYHLNKSDCDKLYESLMEYFKDELVENHLIECESEESELS